MCADDRYIILIYKQKLLETQLFGVGEGKINGEKGMDKRGRKNRAKEKGI